MQELELEKTYYLKSIPKEIEGITPTEIWDIYIPEDSPHAHLRLRKKGNHYMITKKQPKNTDVSEQIENTIPLTKDEFMALASCSNGQVRKNRYKAEINGHAAEVDVFSGKHKGLVLVDFEFRNSAEKNNFIAAKDYIDVTTLDTVAGGVLSSKTYSEILQELKTFGI